MSSSTKPGAPRALTNAERPPDAPTPSKRDPIEAWLDVFVRMLGAKGDEAALIRDELEDHLRTRVDDLLITGMTEPEAVRNAVAELGESADLAGRFRAAMKPRRRTLMHATLIGVTGTAVTAGVIAVAGLGGSEPAVGEWTEGAEANVTALAQPEGVVPDAVAPHDPRLRRYDLSALGEPGVAFDRTRESNAMRESILTLVSPDEWQHMGGSAVLQVVGNTLFVSGTDETHEGVAWVLASLAEDVEQRRHAERAAAERQEHERQRVLEMTRREIQQVTEEITILERRQRDVERRLRHAQPSNAHQRLVEAGHNFMEITNEQAREEAARMQGELDQLSAESTRVRFEIEDAISMRSALRDRLIVAEVGNAPRQTQAGGRSRVPAPAPSVGSGRGGSPAPGDRSSGVYVVQVGDTLASIATELGGDPATARVLRAANPDVDFGRLEVGTRLRLPGR